VLADPDARAVISTTAPSSQSNQTSPWQVLSAPLASSGET